MPRILSFTSGPHDWQALLADPDKHWRTGFSARTLAHSWESADGFPEEIGSAFARSREPLLEGLVPILAFPEFRVPLPGGNRASQNDLFVLARSLAGPVTIMVEGKVNESFDKTLDDWGHAASVGKQERLRFLLNVLGLNDQPPGTIRYQLLHRAVSALMTGEQYRASAAVLLIHSFSQEGAGWTDYQAFSRLFGVEAESGSVQRLGAGTSIPLFGVWIVGNPSFLMS